MNRPRVRAVLFASIILASSALAAPQEKVAGQADGDAQHKRFVILHTNDIHGQLQPRKATWIDKQAPPLAGGLVRLAAFAQRTQKEVEAQGAEFLLVDGGDWFQGTPEGLIGSGLDYVAALSLVGFDALTIGNHEFDFGIANLIELLRVTQLPAVACNLLTLDKDERVPWVEPWKLVTKGGVRIALVGFVTPVTPEITHPDARTIRFQDPALALAAAKRELEGRADWILPLTHLGVEDDRKLARAHPETPLIVGGHSHTYLKEGVREGGTLIVQCGTKISAVGWVEVVWDVAAKKVVSATAKTVDLLDEADPAFVDARLAKAAADLEKKSSADLAVVLGEMTAPLVRSRDPLSSSGAGNLISDALRERGRADVGLVNRGGIRADLQAGPVTRRDVFEMLPFENNLVVLKLKGSELHEMLRRSIEGDAHSGLEFSGLTADVRVDEARARKLVALHVKGEPLDPAATYRVATLSFLADGGDAYLERIPAGDRRTDDVVLARDVFGELLKARGKLTPPLENRYPRGQAVSVLAVACLALASFAQDLATLTAKLRSSDDRQRQQAVQGLAQLGSAEASSLVIDALKDPAANVADEAEIQLAKARDEALYRELAGKRGIASGDEWLQIRAAGVFASSAIETMPRALLVKALAVKSVEARRIVVSGVERLAREGRIAPGGDDRLAAELWALQASASLDPAVRGAALLAALALGEELRDTWIERAQAKDAPAYLCAVVRAAGPRSDAAARRVLDFAAQHQARSVRAQVVASSAERANADTAARLVAMLAAESNDRLAWTIADELERMSGRALGRDAQLWNEWLSNLGAEWKPLTGHARSEPPAGSTAVVYGMPVVSSRIAILVDFSGSLWETRGGRTRKQRVDEELAVTLKALPATTRFNLIPFTSTPIAFEKSLVAATPANVQRALAFFLACKATGQGNVWDALDHALLDPEVDTLLVLTDGAPSGGRRWNLDLMRERFVEKNRFRHVVLDAVLVDAGKGLQERWRTWCEATGGRMKSISLE